MSKAKRVFVQCGGECPARTEHEVILDGSLRCTECGYNIEHADTQSLPAGADVCVLHYPADVVEEAP